MSGDIANLRVFFLTVGEPTAIETLRKFKERTAQPYNLTIWYDACGRGIDDDFLSRLFFYSDDVISLSKNHGPSGALAYAMLYLDFDYLLVVPADAVVEEGYLERFKTALTRFGKVACAGSTRNQFKIPVSYDFVVNAKELEPDGIFLFSREAINDIGGIATVFNGMGQEVREWMERSMIKGWNIVACNNVMTESGSTHDGREGNKNLSSEIAASEKTYLSISDSQWKNFKWWENKKEKWDLANV